MVRGDPLCFHRRLGHAYIGLSRQLAKLIELTALEHGFELIREQRDTQQRDETSRRVAAVAPPPADVGWV